MTIALLSLIAAATGILAVVLFPSREPPRRGTELSLTLQYAETTENRPDVEVDIVHDESGAVSIAVSFYVYDVGEPAPFELYVSGAPAPGDPDQIGFTLEPEWRYVEDLTSSFVPLPGGPANWVAKVEFAGHPSSGFTDNGETILGVVTAARARVPSDIYAETGFRGRLDTATVFSTPDASALYEWTGRIPEIGLGDWVAFVVTADEEISSEEQLQVTGYNASASQSDDRNLFVAGALVGIAGGALTAVVPESVKLANVGRRSERPRRLR